MSTDSQSTDPISDDTAQPTEKTEQEIITLVRPSRHTLIEDAFAISIGVGLVSFGVFLFQQAELVIGGVAGMALVVSYATGLDFGLLFFVINLPFYLFAVGGMGWRFIAKTFAAVALMSVIVKLLPLGIDVSMIHPALASMMGGIMIGLGLLALFRHGAGLGGINILVFWLQTTRGWRAGYVQLGIDACILASALLVIGPVQVAWSLLGAVIFNMILGVNHKPGRYMGVS